MRFKTLLFAAMVVVSTCCSACNSKGASENEAEAKDSTKHLSLLFAGDLMNHQGQINVAKQADGTYDYTECFQFIKDEIESADVAIANFETTLAGPPYKGYPQFCAPDQFLVDAVAAGFDIMLTANNHVCDTYGKGIDRTIAVMDSLKVPHLGSYRNAQEREKNYPYLLEKNGFRIVLLNYTYATNGIKVPEGRVVNTPIDTAQISKDIAKAKTMKPDAIIANMHWGVEYTLTPVKEQTKIADWLFSKGVTHVIGNHPHVVEPVEVRTDAQGNKHVLVYSLGNFISNMSKGSTVGGQMVRIDLEKDSTTRVANCDYSLYFVTPAPANGHKQYRVYPASTPDTQLNAREKEIKNRFLGIVRPFFKKNNKNVKERL